MSQLDKNRMGQDQLEESQVIDMKQVKIDGPTFKALRDYFDEWGEKDSTIFKSGQRDVERKSV